MSQLIISLGATKKTLLSSNKIEAKNYIDTVGKPALILSENDLEIYKKDESFKHLSYHLISNIEKPTLVCIDRNGVSVSNALNATLKRFSEGLLIVDMPSTKEECVEIFDILKDNIKPKIQILINLPSIEFCSNNLHKLHTGWRLFSSISKKDYDWLKDNIGELDAVGLTVTGALRDEYLKTYRDWCKSEKKKLDQLVLNIPFYYSLSTISIDKMVFNELINQTMKKLSLFDIKYTVQDIEEMYI